MSRPDSQERRTDRGLTPAPLANFRDLGGTPVTGGRIAFGKVWRSDDASLIPHAQAADLVARGLGAVIDLRSCAEREVTGRGALERFPVDYHHLPLTQSAGIPPDLARALHEGPNVPAVSDWYAQLVARNGEALAQGMHIVAGTDGTVLFHCSAGKDRTGIFAAVLLSILGASRESIVADYVATRDRMREVRARLDLAYARRRAGRTEAGAPMLIEVDPGNLDAVLTRFGPGGISEFVRAAGLDGETLRRLRTRVVDRPAGLGDGDR